MKFKYKGYEYEVSCLEGSTLKSILDEEGNHLLSVASEFPDDWAWALASAYHSGYVEGESMGKIIAKNQIVSALGLS